MMDKAGRTHWDESWSITAAPPLLDPKSKALSKNVDRALGRVFDEAFAGMPTLSKSLLEAGCGCSATLPYFARHYGFSVSGIDYSEPGCELARRILDAAGVQGAIHHADLFAPPADLLDRFDVVFSYGLVEHFQDTAACLCAVSRFVKPGGLIVTIIPNMCGTIGWLQRKLNEKVYRVHVPLDCDDLRAAHEEAGLGVTRCDYLLSVNFGVISLQGVDTRSPRGFLKRIALAGLARATFLIWAVERMLGAELGKGRRFSPYIVCCASRPRT